jgi:hypothetical protein
MIVVAHTIPVDLCLPLLTTGDARMCLRCIVMHMHCDRVIAMSLTKESVRGLAAAEHLKRVGLEHPLKLKMSRNGTCNYVPDQAAVSGSCGIAAYILVEAGRVSPVRCLTSYILCLHMRLHFQACS